MNEKEHKCDLKKRHTVLIHYGPHTKKISQ
jgi:hypothetical protein